MPRHEPRRHLVLSRTPLHTHGAVNRSQHRASSSAESGSLSKFDATHLHSSLNPVTNSLRSHVATARRLLLAPLIAATTILTACGTDSTAPSTPSNPAVETFNATLGVNIANMTKRSDDLYVQDLVVGSGTEAVAGRALRMTYTGWLANGSRFDSNVGGASLNFTLGTGRVIAGWEQGLVGMRVGGKRKLVIGSLLAYGSRGSGASIPPNATLVFDVELLGAQ
jgi:FKBP-type peptidyl-prolyl cis-trans isomerase FkpA